MQLCSFGFKHDDRNVERCRILLVTEISISGQEDIKAALNCCRKKGAVLNLV